MSEYRVSSRYAKSLITLAQEQGILEEVRQDILLFIDVCRKNRDFVMMLKNPVISNDKKNGIIQALFEGRINPITLSFFRIIIQKNREMLLPSIAEELRHQYNDLRGISMAKVSTVFPLDESLREEFKSVVRAYTGKKEVQLQEEVDEDLIGGYLLKVEGKQVDETLRGKLKELSLKFS